MKFLQSIFLCFTIWVLASLLNAILCGTWLFFFSKEFKYLPGAFFIVLIFTLVFSIPGILIFWIVLLVNRNEDKLFRWLLKWGFIIAAISSLIVYLLPVSEVKGQQLFLSAWMAIASITSIMLHHTCIQSFSVKKIIKAHA